MYFGPSNTIANMRASLQAGADVLDADIRLTADGVLVAAHDDTLANTTNGVGSLRRQTLAQIRSLDAAWTWKDPKGRFSLRGRGVRIPTVEEILTSFPKHRISLEFKSTGGEQTLCTLLRRLDRTNDVYVGSAGDAAVDRFSVLCPEVAITVTDALVPVMQRARASGSPWCSPVAIGQPPFGKGRFVTSDSIRWSHEHGLAIYTWTVDNPADLASLAAIGVDGVYTGRPDLARAVFDRVHRRGGLNLHTGVVETRPTGKRVGG